MPGDIGSEKLSEFLNETSRTRRKRYVWHTGTFERQTETTGISLTVKVGNKKALACAANIPTFMAGSATTNHESSGLD